MSINTKRNCRNDGFKHHDSQQNHEEIETLAEKVISKNLSVRELEELTKYKDLYLKQIDINIRIVERGVKK